MNRDSVIQLILKVGFTTILLGYFLAWLPHQTAGLSLIGLEMGEWTKFLPNMRQGQYFLDRVFFYLPPITLSLMLITWTIEWSNRSWKTWLMRGIAVLISLLAFPPIESIRYESNDQWLTRMMADLLVVIAVALSSQAKRLPRSWISRVMWSLLAVLGVLGASLPLWTYIAVRPEISGIFGEMIGVGPGLVLNTFGHLMVAGAGGYGLYSRSERATQADSIAA